MTVFFYDNTVQCNYLLLQVKWDYYTDKLGSSRQTLTSVKCQTPLHGQSDTNYGQPCCTTPPTDAINGQAHNNSTTRCTTNSPQTDKNLPHPNILTCRDVGLWHCDVANLL